MRATAIEAYEGDAAPFEQIVKELSGWVEARRNRPDARADALIEWLTETCRTTGGGWNDERVIIFTEYRDTQKWLVDLLLTHGFGGDGGQRIATLYGGMDEDDRERTKNEFQARGDSIKAAGHGDKLLVFSVQFSGKRGISIRCEPEN